MFGGKTEQLSGDSGLRRAAELLRQGRIVAFPTETVYGLGGNALDPEAVAKIFAAKERPSWDPVIVHIADRAMLSQVAAIEPTLAARTEALIEAFWPGPLTLLLPRTASIPDSVTAGRPLVGVRMPAHPLALELIRQANIPIAAPSANRFGRTSPTTAAHVLEDLDGRIDAVLDGGPTAVGLESTVFDVGAQTIYRHGGVSKEMLEKVVGTVEVFQPPQTHTTPESLPSPGVGIRHYAPRARLVLVHGQSELSAAITEDAGVMLPVGWNPGVAKAVFPWGPWNDAKTLARRLFAGLRELDESGVPVIVCPVPEMGGLGDAIRDRLKKAAREK
jgi:L-threonylcarbamoyladenylate synthase